MSALLENGGGGFIRVLIRVLVKWCHAGLRGCEGAKLTTLNLKPTLITLICVCRSASPHHGFAAYYTFLEKIFKADAVLHFGTHGSLEFMPGKQVSVVVCVCV